MNIFNRKLLLLFLCFTFFGLFFLFFQGENRIAFASIGKRSTSTTKAKTATAYSCVSGNSKTEQISLWQVLKREYIVWIPWFIEQFKVSQVGKYNVTPLHDFDNIKSEAYANLSLEMKNLLNTICNDIYHQQFKIDNQVTIWNRYFSHQLVNVAWDQVLKFQLAKIKSIYQKKKNTDLREIEQSFLSLTTLKEGDDSTKLSTFQRRVITLFHQTILNDVFASEIKNKDDYINKVEQILTDTENELNQEIFEKLKSYLLQRKVKSQFLLPGKYINNLLNDIENKNNLETFVDLNAFPELKKRIFALPLQDQYWKNKITANLAMETIFQTKKFNGLKIFKSLQSNPWLVWLLQKFNIETVGGVWLGPLLKLNWERKTDYQHLSDVVKTILTFINNNFYWNYSNPLQNRWPYLYPSNWKKIEKSIFASSFLPNWEESFLYSVNKIIWEQSLKALLPKMKSNFVSNLKKIYTVDFSSWDNFFSVPLYQEYSKEANDALSKLHKILLNKKRRLKLKITSAQTYLALLKKLINFTKETAWTKIKSYFFLVKEQGIVVPKNTSIYSLLQSELDLRSKYADLAISNKNTLKAFFLNAFWEEEIIFQKFKIWSQKLSTQKIKSLSGHNLVPFWKITSNSYQTSSPEIKKTIQDLILEPDWERELVYLLNASTFPAKKSFFSNLVIFLFALGGFVILSLAVIIGCYFAFKKQKQAKKQ